jgi:hypothetical protein
MQAAVMPVFEGDIYAAVPDVLSRVLLQDCRNRLRDIIALHFSRMGNRSHTSAVTSKFHEECKKTDPLRSGRALQHGQPRHDFRLGKF